MAEPSVSRYSRAAVVAGATRLVEAFLNRFFTGQQRMTQVYRHFYPDLRPFLTQQLSAHTHHLLVASLSDVMLDLLNQVEVAPAVTLLQGL